MGVLRTKESLRGKVAVVTGAAGGMGRGIAEVLLEAGMQLVIADVDDDTLSRTAAELGVTGYRIDVSSSEDMERLARQVIDRFGAVHVVCNNAGVGPVGNISDLTLADWRWMLDINLWGVIHGVHAFLPLLERNAEGGNIINTSSMSGLLPGPQFGPYTVSKYGVVALTEVLAQELAIAESLVSAGVLLPGPTRTAIATSMRNRDNPARANSGLVNMDLADSDIFPEGIPWKTPREIGEMVLEGIISGELYLFTHPQLSQPIFDRFDRIREASDRAMRRHSISGDIDGHI